MTTDDQRSNVTEYQNAPTQNVFRASNVVRAAIIAFAVLYLFKFVGVAVSFLFAIFLGLLIGLNLSRLADILARWRIPRSVSVGGFALLAAGVFVGGAALLAPTLNNQVDAFRAEVPKAIDSFDARLRSAGISIPTPKNAKDTATVRDSVATVRSTTEPDSTSALRSQLKSQIGSMARMAGTALSHTASALGALFVVIFVAIFYAVEPKLYRNGVLHLVPHKRRERIGDAMSATGMVLRQWLTAQMMAMLSIGVLSTIAYAVIGLKAPVALGIIAGICEFVPFFGPIAAAVPAIGMALADSPEKAIYVAGASLAIQQAEEVLIVPLLMKKNLTLPPILTIGAQGAMGLAFGIPGLLVAVPLLAATMVLVKMLYVEDVIGDPMDIDANGPKSKK